jgi:hypothetical protein
MKIKYISTRETHTDDLYKTGDWAIGETKEVPDDVARKLVRHPDVWSISDEKPTGTVIIEGEKEDNEMLKAQATYELINGMEKDALQSFIKTQFNRNVDMRQYKDVGKLRALATQLTDQFGVLA